MDKPTRRAWSRPELIVIVRGGPEEAVLDGCKYPNMPTSGPAFRLLMCNAFDGTGCGACSEFLQS